VISGAEAVDAWLRGHLDQAKAEELLAESGLRPEDHPIAFGNAGNPLGLEELLEAYRRKFIDGPRFERGFRQSRYRDEWHDIALKLRYRPLSTAIAIDAAVQNHLPIDRARQLAEENGLAPADFDAAYQTAGSPLSRTEAEQLYNRGLMTRAEVEQALRESRLKDKYVGRAFELSVRLPEGRQITQLLEFGAITPAEALTSLLHLGYSQKIAAAFVAEGEARATGGHRQAATGQITSLYIDKLIGRGQAEAMLEKLHYTAGVAALLLDLADHTRRQKILATGITAVRSRYLHRHSTGLEATADLSVLGIPADAIALYLTTWRIERKSVVRTLTEAQIVKAHKLDLLGATPEDNDANALERLLQLGYNHDDALLLIAGA
jgi:hypothetical protein